MFILGWNGSLREFDTHQRRQGAETAVRPNGDGNRCETQGTGTGNDTQSYPEEARRTPDDNPGRRKPYEMRVSHRDG